MLVVQNKCDHISGDIVSFCTQTIYTVIQKSEFNKIDLNHIS